MYKILSLLWPILTGKIKIYIGNKSQSRDKILYILPREPNRDYELLILLAFVFYPVMIRARIEGIGGIRSIL